MPLLIEPEELLALINKKNTIVLDTRFNLGDRQEGRACYRKAHIPKALYADLEEDLSGDIVAGRTGRHPLPTPKQLTETLRRWGICEDSHVVVYDEGSHAMAARAWWLLRWAGIQHVSVLHGGIKTWLSFGGLVTSEERVPEASDVELSFDAMPVISAEEIIPSLDSDQYCLVDARSEERFRGDVEPMDSKAGHIPGAICRPFTQNMGEDGRFLSPEQLHHQFSEILPQHRVPVFYCGSGVTACHNLFAMTYAGLETGYLYPGSWSEWVTQSDHPVAKG